MNYFPEQHSHSKNRLKVELDLSNYATKSDSKFANNDDLASLKLMTAPVNLNKLSNVVKNDFVKKTLYHDLFEKG